MDWVDWVIVVRGASAGFTVLVISGLAHPIVMRINPTAGLIWLFGGSILAYVVAAFRSGMADSPILTGTFAALVSYTLSVPLIYISTRTLVWSDVLMFAGLAVVVGAIVGFIAGQRQKT